MDMKCHEVLEQKMLKELEMVEAKISSNQGQQMTDKDVELIDKLYHALKSLATYKAMKEAEEGMGGGYSGARGRGANGQYISRDGNSYSSGYEQGYDDAMSRMSGHWRPTWNHGGTW